MIVVTKALLEESKGGKGFTNQQNRMGIGILGRSWQGRMVNRCLEEFWWNQFCEANLKGDMMEPKKPVANKRKTAKAKRRALRRKKKREKQSFSPSDFYSSREWRELRYRVIRKYKSACMACGRTPKDHGIVIHCDHIKPRSKHPNLQLVFENLQLLCEDCNLGKGNKDEIDWRPN